MKIEIKKEENKKETLPKKMLRPGPKVRDIKANKAKAVDYKEPINARVIEIKEEKEEKKPNFFKKILIPASSALIVIILLFISFYIFARPKDDLLKFVPKETVFYSRLNLDKLFQNPKNQNINSLLSKFGDPNNLEKSAGEAINKKLAAYNLDFENDIKPNIASEFAFALYLGEENKISPYFIFKIKDASKFWQTVEKIGAKKSQEINTPGAKIQTLLFANPSKNISLTLIKNVAVLSPNKDVVEKIAHAYKTKTHLDLKSNRQKQTFLQLYLNTQSLPPDYFSGLPFLKNNNFPLYYLVLKNQKNIYLELNDEKNGLAIHFLSFGAKEKNNTSSKKLLNLIPDDAIFAISDYNLKKEYQDLKEEFKSPGDNSLPENKKDMPASYLQNFENELRQKYGLNLEDDILSFFEEETAIVILPKSDGKQNLAVLTKIKNINITEAEEKIKNILTNIFAKSNPREEKMKLADGSEATELIADKKAFESKAEESRGTKIYSLTNKKDNKLFASYAIKNDILAVGTNKETVEKIIAGEEKLISNSAFSKSYQKINGQKSQSLLYFNVLGYLNYIGKSSSSQAFWQPAKSFLFGTKTKGDQTLGEGFLLIE